jgi:hypothetical protein
MDERLLFRLWAVGVVRVLVLGNFQMKERPYCFKMDGTPYTGPDAFRKWAKDFEDGVDRVIGKDKFPNGLEVSTVWLGLDHNHGDSHRPLIFESMVFFPDSRADLEMWRYSTLEEAKLGHKMLVKKYRTYKTAADVMSTPKETK